MCFKRYGNVKKPKTYQANVNPSLPPPLNPRLGVRGEWRVSIGFGTAPNLVKVEKSLDN